MTTCRWYIRKYGTQWSVRVIAQNGAAIWEYDHYWPGSWRAAVDSVDGQLRPRGYPTW